MTNNFSLEEIDEMFCDVTQQIMLVYFFFKFYFDSLILFLKNSLNLIYHNTPIEVN